MLKLRSDEETTRRLVASLNSAWIVPAALLGALALAIGVSATLVWNTNIEGPAGETAPPDDSKAVLALRALRAEQLLLWERTAGSVVRATDAAAAARLIEKAVGGRAAFQAVLVTGIADWGAVLPLARDESSIESTASDWRGVVARYGLDRGEPSPGFVDVDGRIGLVLARLLPPPAHHGQEGYGGQSSRLIGVFWLDAALPSVSAAAGQPLALVPSGARGAPLFSPDGRVTAGVDVVAPPVAPLRLGPPAPPAPLAAVAAMTLALVAFGGLALLGVRQRKKTAHIVRGIELNAFDRAMRDPLTGLHNRSGFTARLDQAVEDCAAGSLFGVIYIDLDRFKEVNDSYGHETGDRLLVSVTARLREMCGEAATIARLGGDEFAAIVRRPDPEEIVALGRRITVELGRPFHLNAVEIVIGASVGIAVAPEDGRESAELVRRADISMYRSKTSGRGQAQRFDSSMEDEIRRRKYLEGELRHAIERDELDVFYQPYFAVDGQTLVGVEALMRWRHREEGFISPGVFIPLAEQTGLIVEVSDWAMRKAMADVKSWPGLSLAINVSPVQFRRKDLVASIAALVADAGLDPGRIEIEITEGVLVEDADSAIALIAGFHEQGFKIALDDFGTGYASLSYLRRFKFDKLKVDQYFVKSLSVGSGGAAIIHSVVALGRSLGLTVQAEGVETLEHHIFLRASGCHYLQGFYFAKPMDSAAMNVFFEKHSGAGLRYAQRA